MLATEVPRSAVSDPAALWAAVKQHRARGAFTQAIPMLDELCRQSPTEPRYFLCMGEALIEDGQQEKAAGFLQRALELSPDEPHATEALRKLSTPESATRDALSSSPATGAELESQRAALRRWFEELSGAGRNQELIDAYHRTVRDRPDLVSDIEAWAPMVNDAGMEIYRQNGERPGAWARDVIDEVRENGIALRTFDEAFGDRSLMEELQAVVRSTNDWSVPGKPHFFKAVREDDIAGDHPIMRAALNPLLLEVANGFYGLYSRLVSANIVQTRIDSAPERVRKSSEGWHRDPEDTPMLKAFIYLNDVLEVGHGPFQYIPKSRRGGKYEHILTRFGRGVYDRTYKTRPDWTQVDTEVDPADIVTMLGKAGTMFFCNTSGFHRGGYCLTQDRYMVANVYQRPGSQYPNYMKTDFDPTGQPTAIRAAVDAL